MGWGCRYPRTQRTVALTPEVASTLSFNDGHAGLDHGCNLLATAAPILTFPMTFSPILTFSMLSPTPRYVTWSRADGSRSLVVTYTVPAANGAKMLSTSWRPGDQCSRTRHSRKVARTNGPPSLSLAEECNQSSGTAPEMGYTDKVGYDAWPESRAGKSPWPKWHRDEVFSQPNPQPWNPPTSLELAPGEAVQVALRFRLCKGGPSTRTAALEASGVAVARGVPGYVLSHEMESAKLLVKPPLSHGSPVAIAKVKSEPDGALTFGSPLPIVVDAKMSSYQSIAVKASDRAAGQVRVTVTFTDSSVLACHYFVVPAKSFSELIEKYGKHRTLRGFQ